jgi:hypothetical protein
VSCVSSVCERKCERAMAYGAVATNFSTISFSVSFNPPFDLFFLDTQLRSQPTTITSPLPPPAESTITIKTPTFAKPLVYNPHPPFLLYLCHISASLKADASLSLVLEAAPICETWADACVGGCLRVQGVVWHGAAVRVASCSFVSLPACCSLPSRPPALPPSRPLSFYTPSYAVSLSLSSLSLLSLSLSLSLARALSLSRLRACSLT